MTTAENTTMIAGMRRWRIDTWTVSVRGTDTVFSWVAVTGAT
jgi:phage host-nuclease inhibitor protein Gam